MGEVLADRPRYHFSAGTNIACRDNVYGADSTKVHIKAGKLSYSVARETRILLSSFLLYHSVSQEKLKKRGSLISLCFLKILFIFGERGRRQEEREEGKRQCVVAFRIPPTGTWPATQACA